MEQGQAFGVHRQAPLACFETGENCGQAFSSGWGGMWAARLLVMYLVYCTLLVAVGHAACAASVP